jgi:hypothetical protein
MLEEQQRLVRVLEKGPTDNTQQLVFTAGILHYHSSPAQFSYVLDYGSNCHGIVNCPLSCTAADGV